MALTGPAWDHGRDGERIVKLWLQSRGYVVLPATDIENGGAPVLEGLYCRAVVPDFLAAHQGASRFVEVKTKSYPTQLKKDETWWHGIKLRHWLDYRACEEQTGIPCSLCIYEGETNLILLQTCAILAPLQRLYTGRGMPDHVPYVFFPRDAFAWHAGPVDGVVPPRPPRSPRTQEQPPAPREKQEAFGASLW